MSEIDLQTRIDGGEVGVFYGTGGGGDVNVIEKVKYDGVALAVDETDKSVNIPKEFFDVEEFVTPAADIATAIDAGKMLRMGSFVATYAWKNNATDVTFGIPMPGQGSPVLAEYTVKGNTWNSYFYDTDNGAGMRLDTIETLIPQDASAQGNQLVTENQMNTNVWTDGIMLRSPNGMIFKVSVDNSGSLIVSSLR